MTVYGRRCFYCFVFILLAPGTRHETGQQFKLEQGPEKGCAGCLIPEPSHSLWWLTHIFLPGKSVGRDICESVLFIPGFMLYISIVFNSKT
jgi:hypothetical protein